MKENYDAKILGAIDFAIKKCHFNFVPMRHMMLSLLIKLGFGKSVCYIVVPLICL